MIGKLALLLLPAMNLAGSGDRPIVPITREEITLSLAAASGTQDICDAYPALVAGLNGVIDDYNLATDMADDWILTELANSYDPTGDSRLTNEARDVVLNWLHQCPTPFDPTRGNA
jgi:hypothetical protein